MFEQNGFSFLQTNSLLLNIDRWYKLIQKPFDDGDERGLMLLKAILRPLMLRRTKDSTDKDGRWGVTPMFVSIVVLDYSDLMFCCLKGNFSSPSSWSWGDCMWIFGGWTWFLWCIVQEIKGIINRVILNGMYQFCQPGLMMHWVDVCRSNLISLLNRAKSFITMLLF